MRWPTLATRRDHLRLRRPFACSEILSHGRLTVYRRVAPFTARTDRRLPLPVCALNFPIRLKPGLAKAIGVVMKLDFERAVLNRVPVKESHPERYFRQVLFLCDEYQHLRPSA